MKNFKCSIAKAKEYQKGFKAGLQLVGFEDNKIQWLGTSKSFNQLDEDGDDLMEDKLQAEYQEDMAEDYNENSGD